jgi:hypothetical protein
MVRLTGDGKAMISQAETRWADAMAVPFARPTVQEQRLLVQLTAKLTDGLAANEMMAQVTLE